MKRQIHLIKKLFLLLLVTQLAMTGYVFGQPLNFVAHLTGDEEVPPVDTKAQGQVKFQLSPDGTELYYKVIVANINNLTMAHIHMAPRGENGPVVAWLYPSPSATMGEPIPGRSNGVLVEGIITAEDVRAPLDGFDNPLDELILRIEIDRAYVNVHTIQNGTGEIRGQIH